MTADQFHQKYGTSSIQAQPPQQPSNNMSWLPGIAGGVGQFGGGALGALIGGAGGTAVEPGGGTALGGITGEQIGQRIGGTAGQGLGEYIRQALTGQKTNLGAIANQAGQGFLWSNLPGGNLVKGISSPILRMLAQTGVRAAGGAGVGAATQGMQNLQQGKPLTQNISQTAAETGGINAVLPGVGAFGKEVVQSHLGNSESILQNILNKYLITGGKTGADYTENPNVTSIVKKNLSDPKTAAKSLSSEAENLYKTQLQPAFEKTAVPLKEFVDSLTQKGGYMFSDKEGKVINNALLKMANASDGLAKTSIDLVRDTAQRTGLANAVSGLTGKIPISLDAINEFKKAIPYSEDTSDLYRITKQFIEDKMAGTPVADLNKTYHALEDAGGKLEQKRLDAGGKLQTQSNMNWSGRIKAGGIGAVLQALAGFATGNPPTSLSMYSGIGPISSIVTKMLADEAQQYPHTAVPYAQGLKTIENTGGQLMKLLQSVSPRLPGMINSQ